MDHTNKFTVLPAHDGEGNSQVHAHGYTAQILSADDALNLAAWLVRAADPGGKQFAKVLKAVNREP